MKYAIQETAYSYGKRFLPVQKFPMGPLKGSWISVPAAPTFKSYDEAVDWLRNKLNPPKETVIYHEFIP